MRNLIYISLLFLGFNNSYAQKSDSSFFDAYSISAGVNYSDFSTYGWANFNRISSYHWIVPRSTPIVGLSGIKENINTKSCCNYFRAELSVSYNHSEFSNYNIFDTIFKESTGSAQLFYTYLSGQYGWKLGDRWRLGPVFTIGVRIGSLVDDQSKPALSDFGFFNLENDKFNKNLNRFDASLGASIIFKLNNVFFIEGDLNYGFLKQIEMENLPNIHAANASLSLGYVILK